MIGFSAGLIVIDDRTVAPPTRPIVAPPHRIPRPILTLETTQTLVDAAIQDQHARVVIDQEFYNPNDVPCEGSFLFPVPKGAQLDRFTLTINGKPVEAELLGADKARAIYEDIVRRAQDPALLEYLGRDLFKVRVFPIDPHSRRQIQISYSQLLLEDSGLIHWILPLHADAGGRVTQVARSLSVKVTLDSSQPLQTIYSPSHKVEINRQGDRKAVVAHQSSAMESSGDFQLYFSRSRSEVGIDLMTYATGEDEGFFLLLANPRIDPPAGKLFPKDVVFVLDASGSMAGKKLEQAKKALRFCVENLNDQDGFEVLRFSTEIDAAFGGLRSAGADTRRQAEAFVEKIRPTGGTAIYDALVRALGMRPVSSERPFVVVFLTDGLPTVGVTDPKEILKAVTGGKATPADQWTRVFCFGIGTDVNTHLLDEIADFTKASSAYVLPDEDIEVKVSSFFSRIKDPALANVHASFPDGIRATRIHPNPLPDLYRGQQLLVVGRYEGARDGNLVLSGNVAGEKREFTQFCKFPKRDNAQDWLPRLWATRRIGHLLDEIRLRGESQELKDEVVELAKKYAVITPYTAYLVSEDETRRGIAVNHQLIRMSGDAPTQQLYRDQFRALTRDKSGDLAVASSRSFQYLKDAGASDASIALGVGEVSRPSLLPAGSPASMPKRAARDPRQPGRELAAVAPSPIASPVRVETEGASTEQPARYVSGKSFFQRGEQWIDAEAQSMKDSEARSLEFGSEQYFKLLASHPEARVWLALGRNLQVVIGRQLYDIH